MAPAAAKRVRPRKAHYAAAKMGLVPLTQALAHEVGDLGIRVNCIVVGLVAGELVDRWVTRIAAERRVPEDRVRAGLVADFPVKRPLEADEIAAVSLFLASEAASGITGQSVNVTNGALTY